MKAEIKNELFKELKEKRDREQDEAKVIYLLNQTTSEEGQRYLLHMKTVREKLNLPKELRAPKVEIISLIEQLEKLKFRDPIEKFIGEIETNRAKVRSKASESRTFWE